MRLLQGILAIIGAVALVAGGIGYTKYQEFTTSLDPEAPRVFKEMYDKFKVNRDWGDAMMWSFPVANGVGPEEVKQSLTSLAYERNFFFAGEAPFYKQAEAATGKPYRYVNFLNFCDARVGMLMIDYNDKYSGLMPCRIAIVQDKTGQVWLHSMNLDLMIYGGKPLPPELKEQALKVRNTLYEIMKAAAAGEF
jgi:hypothetical protein